MENNHWGPAKIADLEKPCPFHQAKAWEEQDALHNLVPDRRQGFHLPDTVKVEYAVPEGQRRQFAEIVPDQGKHGYDYWESSHRERTGSRRAQSQQSKAKGK